MTEQQALLDGNERLKIWNDATQAATQHLKTATDVLHQRIAELETQVREAWAEGHNSAVLEMQQQMDDLRRTLEAEIERLRTEIEGKRV